ncbi:unnamed protein product [Symbiodinium natans]|uniref:Reverse transcriptase domain-containing protein n=1 Tax=Symbiodinium natans TaxID=878477 RepID=A0A812LJ31_9DINO|nr:unnamed protein product [Symbiodinium natans]
MIQLMSSLGHFWLLEHPEDLGRLPNGDDPASIWQWPQIRTAVGDAPCWGLRQCDYSADTPKPTRLASNLPGARVFGSSWPSFQEDGTYAGPILRCDHHHGPGARWSSGQWRTAGTEAYPSPLCAFLADLIASALSASFSTDGPEQHAAEQFAKFLLQQDRPPAPHDAEALITLLPLEAPHVSAQTAAGQAFFGGAYCKGGVVGLRRSCREFPATLRVLCTLLRHAFPGQIFSSVAVFVDAATQMPRDSHNAPYPNLLLALSTFSNGQVWQQDQNGDVWRTVHGTPCPGVLLDVARAPQLLRAWESRVVLVGYCVRQLPALDVSSLSLLSHLGFLLPPSVTAGVARGDTAETLAEPSGPVADAGTPLASDKERATGPHNGAPVARPAPEWQHAERVQRAIRNFVLEEVGDLRKAALQLAVGRMKSSPFSEQGVQRLRQQVASMLPDPDLALQVPERQPFLLHLLSQSLKLLGDPDWACLSQGEECFAMGVPLGDEVPLPRTPQVYRERVKERTLDVTPFQQIMNNYESAELSADKLEEHFAAEERAGRMIPSTEPALRAEYGDTLLVASMGALLKPNGDIRPLHDGTHGIGLNNRIKILDRLEMPGPDEILETVALGQESKEAVFCISADIAQAHRLTKVRRADWAKLGCKARSEARTVWVNTVGTFGISSAAYHWSRLFGCIGRWVHRVMLTVWQMQVVFADDLHLLTAGQHKFLTMWMCLAAYELVGTPFAYRKFRGGTVVDFVGYEISYSEWRAGISERRCSWLVKWILEAEQADWIVVGRSVIELAGHSGSKPVLVYLCLIFVRRQLQDRGRLVRPVVDWRASRQAFRADAKCAPNRVVLGGWLLGKEGIPRKAPWFSLALSPSEAPWLFKPNGESQWASTAAELLASYVALVAFGLLEGSRAFGDTFDAVLVGGTDNQATPQAQARGSSASWPLLGILMQVTATLQPHGAQMKLVWRPHETNVEADDLTNENFALFDSEQRVKVSWDDIPMDFMRELAAAHEDFLEAKSLARASAGPKMKSSKKQKLAERTSW